VRWAVLAAALAACGGAARVAPAPRTAGDERFAPGDHLVMLDGAPLAYHVAGTGPVCLAWPGGPGIDSGYLHSDAERHLTLVYVDPVGTGASARLEDPAGYTRARDIADLEKLRDKLGLEKPCVLGHGYGGMIVLGWAVAHPERVGRLILYDATARIDREWNLAAREALAARKDAPWFAEVARGFGAETKVTTDDEATRAIHQVYPAYFHQWKDAFVTALSRSRAYAAPMTAVDKSRFDVRAELAKLDAPVLVLAGRHDFVCGPRFAEEIAAGIKGARLHIFENSGHFAHLEEPSAFAAAIADFLK
jgi:proline iminopeptidase